MSYKVVKAFTDKMTNVVYPKGSDYQNEDEKRLEFLQSAKYIVKTNEENEEMVKNAKPKKTKKELD